MKSNGVLDKRVSRQKRCKLHKCPNPFKICRPQTDDLITSLWPGGVTLKREEMTQPELSNARNPDLRASLAALQRAARMAREIAIQTNTAIVVVQNGKVVRISADELRKDQGTP